MGKSLLVAAALVWSALFTGMASAQQNTPDETWIDDFDPRDPRAEQLLKEFDKIQEEETGMPSWIRGSGFEPLFSELVPFVTGCYQDNCNVFVRVSKRNQKLYLSVAGTVQDAWAVSSGKEGFATPDFDTHPSGRVYDRYSSSKYPGGDWKGLGNMPYAVFIRGGFALHGTPEANWPHLGERASHGCIRMHPDNAKTINRLVRANGIAQTWITVED